MKLVFIKTSQLALIFIFCLSLVSCSEEELDCLKEQNKITQYYNDLIEDAIGDIEEQERLKVLKAEELANYDCLWRWNSK